MKGEAASKSAACQLQIVNIASGDGSAPESLLQILSRVMWP